MLLNGSEDSEVLIFSREEQRLLGKHHFHAGPAPISHCDKPHTLRSDASPFPPGIKRAPVLHGRREMLAAETKG